MAMTKNLLLLFIFLLSTGLSINIQAGPVCGDGVAEGDEECDTGTNATSACTNTEDLGYGTCKLTFCGDGFQQDPNGAGFAEECDDGAGNGDYPAICSLTCQVNVAPTTTSTSTSTTTTTTTTADPNTTTTTTTTADPNTTTSTTSSTSSTTSSTTTTTVTPTTTTTTATPTTTSTTTATPTTTTTATPTTTTTTAVSVTTTTATPTTTTTMAPTTTTTTMAPPTPVPTETIDLPDGGSVTITTAEGEGLTGVAVGDATGGPSDVSFPFGVISYTTSVPNAGDSVTIRMEFDDNLPENLVLFKVDAGGVYTELPANLWTQVNATTVDVTLTDGDPLTDLDGAADGSIDDPIAVGGEASFPFFGGDGGGGCTLNTQSTASMDPIWLLLLVAPGIGYLRRRLAAQHRAA